MNIKGEYEFTISIQNMFHNYKFITKNHNIVTDEGLILILKCALNQSEEFLGNVYVGKNDVEAKKSDTINTFKYPIALPHTSIDVTTNSIIYNILTDGENIDETTEIGIWGTDGSLVTRDVHDRYDIPHSAQISLKYMLTLTNKNNEELEEEELIYD